MLHLMHRQRWHWRAGEGIVDHQGPRSHWRAKATAAYQGPQGHSTMSLCSSSGKCAMDDCSSRVLPHIVAL